MAFDFKKEDKEYYKQSRKPVIVTIPRINYLAVRGVGNPNTEGGEYKKSIELLYGIAYTIKMSKMGNHQISGYFDFVVPPLEGFWWQEGVKGVDISKKETFNFISLIRLPDFVTPNVFSWAIEEATMKRKEDYSKVECLTYEEGLCVQCMHIGPFDTEIETVKLMDEYLTENNYDLDINDRRYHHEIYLSDFRKSPPEKLKTIIRHPIKKSNIKEV